VSPTATAERVVADSLTAVNGFSTPAAIRLTRESIGAGNRFVLDMSPHSVAVVTLDLVK
jgi:hypothetical protein